MKRAIVADCYVGKINRKDKDTYDNYMYLKTDNRWWYRADGAKKLSNDKADEIIKRGEKRDGDVFIYRKFPAN